MEKTVKGREDTLWSCQRLEAEENDVFFLFFFNVWLVRTSEFAAAVLQPVVCLAEEHKVKSSPLTSCCFVFRGAAGEVLGDVFEVSRIRREDYEFHKGKSEYEDILQCNNLPSSATPRGHQTPAAFLIMTSGLDKVLAAFHPSTFKKRRKKKCFGLTQYWYLSQHGVDSDTPLPYSHVDIAGSSGPFPGVPTGAPILAMATNYIMSDGL